MSRTTRYHDPLNRRTKSTPGISTLKRFFTDRDDQRI